MLEQSPTIPQLQTRSDSLPTQENRNLDDLPGTSGLPFFGDTFKLLTDPKKAQGEYHQKYGNVIKIDVLFQRGVLLLGLEANELVMLDKEKNF